jgi:hypothetical protein
MQRDILGPLNSSPQLKQRKLADLFKKQQQSETSSPYHSGNDSVRVHCSEQDEQPFKKRRVAADPSPALFEPKVTSKLARHRRATSVQDIFARSAQDPRNRVHLRSGMHLRGASTANAQVFEVALQSDVLTSFISHDNRDVYRCLSNQESRHFATPFAVAASHMAKRGGRQIIMAATEEGFLNTFDINQPYSAPSMSSSLRRNEKNSIRSSFSRSACAPKCHF